MLLLRKRLAAIFEDDDPRNQWTRLFNWSLAILIVANVSGIVLESVESIRREFSAELEVFERCATAVFAVEYLLRVWASVDFHNARYRPPFVGRLRYMASFFALVDLVAVLPAIIGVLGAADLRVLRLLRLLRMLKLIRHSTTFGLLAAVLREEARSIGALLFILVLTVAISGSLMYLFEGDAQPAVFSSIPASMWWAIETLTTVGYGDMVPTTLAGRLLGGVVSIVGIGTLALFSGLITVGFLDQLKHHREQTSATLAADPHGPARLPAGAHAETVRFAEPQPMPLGAAATPRPMRVCPHCGGPLPGAPAH
jgi:voltage-gated potassium channel